MQNKDDKRIWDAQADSIDVDFYLNTYIKNPAEWHKSLVHYINSIGKDGDRTIEVGCFSGITTLLLDRKFKKTILDYSEKVLEKAKELFSKANQPVDMVCADMFHIPVADKSFNIVFNSGVIEHLDFSSRVAHLQENARIMKDDGTMIIAYPNHSSWYYRLAYLKLKREGRWNYPDENKLYDMRKEINAAGLNLMEKKVFDPQTALVFLFRHSKYKDIAYAIGKFLGLGGYLMVLRISKGTKHDQ